MNGIIKGIFLSGLVAFVSSLDEEAVKEQRCKKDLPTTKMLDVTWFASVERWYSPYWSKLEAYRLYSDVLEKDIKELTEEDIKNSCVYTDKGGVAMHAFNQTRKNKMKTADSTPVSNPEGDQNHSVVGDVFLAMTDNQTYILTFTCFSDDQLTWGISSVAPTIKPEIKEQIFQLLKTVEFRVEDDKYYEEINYDSCDTDIKSKPKEFTSESQKESLKESSTESPKESVKTPSKEPPKESLEKIKP